MARPVIWIDTSALSFSAYEAGGNPAVQAIRVKNSGRDTLRYTLSDDADWLSAEPDSGASSGDPVEHAIRINKDGLTAREADYEATLMVVCPEAYNNPQRIKVSLKLSSQPPPEIGVSPAELAFAVKVGKNPPEQTIRIRNAGMGTLDYSIAWDAAWLNVAPAGGSSDGEEILHIVSVDSKGMPEGDYEGAIAVSAADAPNSPRAVKISLKVSATAPPPTDNAISISCNPASAGTGTLISIPISISGNLQSISTYGLDLHYDGNLFQYVGTSKGSLTASWTLVDGNPSGSGTVTVGGFAGTGSAVPAGSSGSIAVVTLRVTGAGYTSGHQSQLSIDGYADDIAGLVPQPATTIFTFR